MSLPAGNKLGPYENQSPLGRAGCAKCTARDTRLNSITPGSATRKLRGSPLVTIAIALTKDFPALGWDNE